MLQKKARLFASNWYRSSELFEQMRAIAALTPSSCADAPLTYTCAVVLASKSDGGSASAWPARVAKATPTEALSADLLNCMSSPVSLSRLDGLAAADGGEAEQARDEQPERAGQRHRGGRQAVGHRAVGGEVPVTVVGRAVELVSYPCGHASGVRAVVPEVEGRAGAKASVVSSGEDRSGIGAPVGDAAAVGWPGSVSRHALRRVR